MNNQPCCITTRSVLLSALLAICVLPTPEAAADTVIVQDSQPRAEIIIAEAPPRTTRLAAHELQQYLQRISGAKLPISTEPSSPATVKIFVGQSPHTDKLEISTDDLKYGAYRIISRDNRIVLIGDDTNFTPIAPWPRNHTDWMSGRVHAEWDKITGATWGNPMPQLRKHYTGSTVTFGTPQHDPVAKDGTVHVWGFDERGSFNAVCGLLRHLGVRWYLPGELGQVVPSMTTISIPDMDETVQPDFPVRRFNFRFGVHGHDTAMWAMRLGTRDPYGLQIAHGMHTMTHRDEIFKAHPDWFALYGGKRDTKDGQQVNQLCYSNEELFQETLRYVRALFDHYQFDVVSVMPPDAYVAICQCPLCKGKDSPDRDNRGQLSDHVWDFVNRVAKEIKKTHPDKMISNCAYGTYTLPPENIDKLESNVLVCIVGGRRPTRNRPEQQDEIRRLRESWLKKTDNPIMVFENYPFTARGWYLPSYVAHTLGDSINATKGISQGEDIWLSFHKDVDKAAIGFNHFLVYFTARMYWGGTEQSVDDLFNEYCRLFYGPAESEMKAFFKYCKDNWQDMEQDKSKVDKALALFEAAQRKTQPDSVYGKRIALIADYLKALKNKGEQLAKQRGLVPRQRLARDAEGIVIDGHLDDDFWKNAHVLATGHLRELQTGRKPLYGTSFQAAWGKDSCLYFAIRCEDRKGEPLNIGTTRDKDRATWYGDLIEILLETEAHSYYQIVVNPSGARIDLDRGASRNAWFNWDSQAEVATHIADDHWTVEIRIPVVPDDNDPLHQVVGRKPSISLPWFFNICRQRIHDNGGEYSAFSPTGTNSFHKPLKFAHLYEGLSHQFPYDPAVTDYLDDRRAAHALTTQRKHEEAIAAFTAMAAGDVTDFQKSDALEQAAACARTLRQFDLAVKLADEIPIEAVAKTVRMHNLLATRKSADLVDQFRDEPFSGWPFWKLGEGLYLRGQAFADTGAGEQAETDLTKALEFTTDGLDRLKVWLAIGTNREQNLHEIDAALEAYQQIVNSPKYNGSWIYFRGLLGAVRILRETNRVDQALATLQKVDISNLRGYWHGSLLVALGDTLLAANRKNEALAACREVLTDEKVGAADRKKAEEMIKTIENNTAHP